MQTNMMVLAPYMYSGLLEQVKQVNNKNAYGSLKEFKEESMKLSRMVTSILATGASKFNIAAVEVGMANVDNMLETRNMRTVENRNAVMQVPDIQDRLYMAMMEAACHELHAIADELAVDGKLESGE